MSYRILVKECNLELFEFGRVGDDVEKRLVGQMLLEVLVEAVDGLVADVEVGRCAPEICRVQILVVHEADHPAPVQLLRRRHQHLFSLETKLRVVLHAI